MLEKTGNVSLTQEELIQIQMKNVPERLKQTWDLSLSELESIISAGNYRLINDETKTEIK